MMHRNVLRTIAILLGLFVALTEAQAISRYDSTSMNCSTIQAKVQGEGAVILRWIQPPDILRYDRYVANGGFCFSGMVAKQSSVPSADRSSCPVYHCVRCNRPFFGGFGGGGFAFQDCD